MTVLQEKMSSNKITNYAYLIGRIRGLERGVLNNRLLENALKAEDLEQTLRVLTELPYLSEVFQNVAKNPPAIDRALTDHFWGTLNEIATNRYGTDIANFFQLTFDFNDLKLIVKRHLAKSGSDKEYPSTFDWKRALRYVAGESSEYLNDVYRYALNDALAGYENTHHVQQVDHVLDRAYLEEVKRIADANESKVIKNWLIAYIIFAYLRAAFRARFQQSKIDWFRSIYFENPYIRFEDLAEIINGPEEKVVEIIVHQGFHELLPHEGEYRNDPYSLSEIERNMDNYLMRFIRPYRIQAFGPEPVFGFLYAKMTDIRNLRILLHGKYFGIDETGLRNKLRECYYE